MKKLARRTRIIGQWAGISFSAALAAIGLIALRHALETPQPLKSLLPGEAQLYVWRRRSIFYKVAGAAEAEPLVLLHTPDIGASSQEMEPLMEALALDHRVYALDLLGFGHSDKPGIEYSSTLYAELCQDFLREVVRKPAILVASQLSCNYAVAAAASVPELCTALVLISPIALHREQSSRMLFRRYVEQPLVAALLYPLLCSHLAFLLARRQRDNEQADFARFHAITHQLGAEHAVMALLAGRLDQDITQQFEVLAQPVLLIWGAQALAQRTVTSRHNARQDQPAHTVEVIQGAGFFVHQEQPERVIAAIRCWQQEAFPHLPSRAATQLGDVVDLIHAVPAVEITPDHQEPPQEMAAVPEDKAQEHLVLFEHPTVAPEQSGPSVASRLVSKEQLEIAPEQPGPDTASQPVRSDVLLTGLDKPAKPSSTTLQAYCIKCKKKTTMQNAREFTMKNGRPASRGTCASCGTTITRIGKVG